MQISATSSIPAIQPIDRQTSNTPLTSKTQQQDNAEAVKASKAAEEQAAKVFTPAPPLRPNIQDYVDINRTLISLRKF